MPQTIATIARKLDEQTEVDVWGEKYPTIRRDKMPTVARLQATAAFKKFIALFEKVQATEAAAERGEGFDEDQAIADTSAMFDEARKIIKAYAPSVPDKILSVLDESELLALVNAFLQRKPPTSNGNMAIAAPEAEATPETIETPETSNPETTPIALTGTES